MGSTNRGSEGADVKERILYKETYRPHAAKVKDHLLPTLPYVTDPGLKVCRVELRAAGTVELDGQRLEFQDTRIYFAQTLEQK
jgi:hypothetical protein